MALEQFKTQVLLLHSEQSTLDTLRAGFNDQYELHCATSGTEALNTLGATPIHVIVSAHKLPGMSGLDALREAKKRSPDTITILMAGAQADDGLEALVSEKEIFQVVRGEISAEKLRELVDNATKAARLVALAESANDTSADVDETGEHIVMETGNNGSFLISDGTGKVPILNPEAMSPESAANIQKVDVLVLTQDDEFLNTVRESALGMHKVHHAVKPEQAGDFVRNFPVGVFVTDAAQAGSEIEAMIQRMRAHQHRLVAVVAGRRDDGDMLMDLINRGQVYRFLLKPVSPGRSRLAIEASIKHHLEGSEHAFKARPAAPTGKYPRKPEASGSGPKLVSTISGRSLDEAFDDDANSFTETMTGIAISVGKSISSAAGSLKQSKKEDVPEPAVPELVVPELVVPTLSAATESAPAPTPVDDIKPGLPSLSRPERSSGSSSKLKMLAAAIAVVLAAGTGFVLMGGGDEPVTTARGESDSRVSTPVPAEAPSRAAPEPAPVATAAEPDAEPAAVVDAAESAPEPATVVNAAESEPVSIVNAAEPDPEPAAVVDTAEANPPVSPTEPGAATGIVPITNTRPATDAVAATDPVQTEDADPSMEVAQATIAAPAPDDVATATASVAGAENVAATDTIPAASELDPQVADLLARARQARNAGDIYAPTGNNAVELLIAARQAAPDNAEIATELDALMNDVFGAAETALLENRLADAGLALQAVSLAAPENPRLNFLRTQLAQQQLRATLDDARLAIREARFDDAGQLITRAEELAGGQTADTGSLAEELATARDNQRLTEVLNRAGERLATDQLLLPANDNALHYYELARNMDADNTAAQQGLLAVAGKLVLKARAAIDAGDLGEAESLLASARSLDPDGQQLVAAGNALSAARTAAAAPPAAEQEELGGAADANAAAAADQRPATATASAPAEPTTAAAAEPARSEIVAINTLRRVSYVPPKYPRIAQRRDISGHVDIAFTVSTTGKVADIEVTDSEPNDVFDKSAIEAVGQWEFEPVIENGKPTEKRAAVRLSFNLQ